MDNSFRYRHHISYKLQKAYGSLRILYPYRSYLPQKVKLMLCDSLVLSHLNFGSQLYSPCLDFKCKQKVQKLQNSCLRYTYGIRKYQHISHKLKTSKWLNMENRFTLARASLYHTIILTQKPAYLYNKVTYRTDIHNVNIRRKDLITLPQYKLSLFRRSFTYDLYILYNSLSTNTKQLTKKHFKKHLFKTLFDSQWKYLRAFYIFIYICVFVYLHGMETDVAFKYD